MITLAASLTAHQKQAARSPDVRLYASAARASYPVLRWARWYTGSEPDAPTACAVAADGSLVRARNAAGTLYVSRVAAPGSGSTYSSWSSIGAIALSGSGIALAAKSGEDNPRLRQSRRDRPHGAPQHR